MKKALANLFILLIKGYQKIVSPYLGSNCRYHPTCSEYSKICFERFSIPKALWYSARRILRCHPWAKSGEDLPPEK